MKHRLYALVLAVGTAVCVPPAVAHHSFAIFDHDRTYTLKGTVREFRWTNPHGYIELDVEEGGPEGLEQFTIELTSINMLRRAHWKSSDVKVGDEVTAIVAPLLSGEPGGLLLELTVPDGRVLVPPVPAIQSFKRTP